MTDLAPAGRIVRRRPRALAMAGLGTAVLTGLAATALLVPSVATAGSGDVFAQRAKACVAAEAWVTATGTGDAAAAAAAAQSIVDLATTRPEADLVSIDEDMEDVGRAMAGDGILVTGTGEAVPVAAAYRNYLACDLPEVVAERR